MKNVRAARCKNYDACCSPSNTTNVYKGYCIRCFVDLFPGTKISRNYKTKEKAVATFLRGTFPALDMMFDKRVPGGSSKLRPDVYVKLNDHIVVIEVDENQHGAYSCEEQRMQRIVEDGGSTTATFVRFNPDAYKDEADVIQSSCFGVSKETGLVEIVDDAQWSARLAALRTAVAEAIATPPDQPLKIISLFFDAV